MKEKHDSVCKYFTHILSEVFFPSNHFQTAKQLLHILCFWSFITNVTNNIKVSFTVQRLLFHLDYRATVLPLK